MSTPIHSMTFTPDGAAPGPIPDTAPPQSLSGATITGEQANRC